MNERDDRVVPNESRGAPPELPPSLAWALLNGSSDGLLAFDTQFRYTFWNAEMERISGMRAADVIGQNAFDLFPFLVKIGHDDIYRRVLVGQQAVANNRRYSIPGTGRHGHFDGRYLPLRDPSGAIIGGVGIIRDTTEQRASEQLLHETETRFRNMADVAPVLLWMSDTDGLCTFFNQTWLSFTGRTLEEEWGVGWAEGVHFEDFQRCMDTYVEAFNERRVFEMEYRLRRADGEYRWILDRGTPRYLPDGSFAGYIGSCADISDRKRWESDLRKAVQVRDEFISIASHELKTPLTSLQLQLDMLTRQIERRTDGVDVAPPVRNAVQRATNHSERLAKLVNELLDVSRIGSGQLDLHLEEVELSALVQDVVNHWRAVAAAAHSEVSVRTSTMVTGRWDRLRLEQALGNLLSNAIKYGAGKPIDVDLVEDVAEDCIQISVCDRGIGIDREHQDRIFERFERAVSSRNYGGLGLGLWMTREFIGAMGGRITVASAPDAGATFVIALPRGAARSDGVPGVEVRPAAEP